MTDTQDTAIQISRANRGFRGPQQTDEFLQTKNMTLTYNGSGDIDTITMAKDIPGSGTKTKTIVFVYTLGKLTSVVESIL